MKCYKDGCDKQATHIPDVRVPAKGWPLDLHTPLHATMDIKLCKEHALSDAFIDWPGVRDRIAEAARAGGVAPPDFDRAYVEAIKIGSDEHKGWMASIEKAKRSHFH